MNEGDLSTISKPVADLSCLLIGKKHCLGVITNESNLPNGRGFVTMETSPILVGEEGKRLNLGVFQMCA